MVISRVLSLFFVSELCVLCFSLLRSTHGSEPRDRSQVHVWSLRLLSLGRYWQIPDLASSYLATLMLLFCFWTSGIEFKDSRNMKRWQTFCSLHVLQCTCPGWFPPPLLGIPVVPVLLCPPLQKVLGWIHVHVDEFTRHSTSAISNVTVSNGTL